MQNALDHRARLRVLGNHLRPHLQNDLNQQFALFFNRTLLKIANSQSTPQRMCVQRRRPHPIIKPLFAMGATVAQSPVGHQGSLSGQLGPSSTLA
jgi:hypothetical protein